MKIGYQTISWGRRLARRDIAEMLEPIAEEGCEGVEFMQRAEVLPRIEGPLRLLESHGLKFIGLTGDSLKQRMDFCGKDVRPEYLYIETWNKNEASKPTDAGFTLGLYPHAQMPVRDVGAAPRLSYAAS